MINPSIIDWKITFQKHNLDNASSSSEKASDLDVTCFDWCGGRIDPPPTLVVGDSTNVNVYRYFDKSEDWGLLSWMGPICGVIDVGWSPDVGCDELTQALETDNPSTQH